MNRKGSRSPNSSYNHHPVASRWPLAASSQQDGNWDGDGNEDGGMGMRIVSKAQARPSWPAARWRIYIYIIFTTSAFISILYIYLYVYTKYALYKHIISATVPPARRACLSFRLHPHPHANHPHSHPHLHCHSHFHSHPHLNCHPHPNCHPAGY